jgi:hypothetical protein
VLEAFGELLHLSRAIDLVQLLPDVLHMRGILLRNVHGLLRCLTSDRVMGSLLLLLLVQDHLAFSFLLWHIFWLLSVHLHVASLVLLRWLAGPQDLQRRTGFTGTTTPSRSTADSSRATE